MPARLGPLALSLRARPAPTRTDPSSPAGTEQCVGRSFSQRSGQVCSAHSGAGDARRRELPSVELAQLSYTAGVQVQQRRVLRLAAVWEVVVAEDVVLVAHTVEVKVLAPARLALNPHEEVGVGLNPFDRCEV